MLYRLVVAVQNLGYFPEAVLNLITNIGAGFTVRETAGMDMQQLIDHVSTSRHCRMNLQRYHFFLKPGNSEMVGEMSEQMQKVGEFVQDGKYFVTQPFYFLLF